MNGLENKIPALPAMDVTLALQSNRPGVFARQHPTALATLPFSALISRRVAPSDERPHQDGESALVNAYPEGAWGSLWVRQHAEEPGFSKPASTHPNAPYLPELPAPGEYLIAGNMQRSEITWQGGSSLWPTQGLQLPRLAPFAPWRGMAEELPVPNKPLGPVTSERDRSVLPQPPVSYVRQFQAANSQPTRSGFGRLLNFKNKSLSTPSQPQTGKSALKETASQLPVSLPWLRRPLPETSEVWSEQGIAQQPELPSLRSGLGHQQTFLTKLIPNNSHLASPLPVVQQVIEHLVQHEVRTEISRQHNANKELAEPSGPNSTPDLTSDEVVRRLMSRMQVLAQEDRFRLGYLA